MPELTRSACALDAPKNLASCPTPHPARANSRAIKRRAFLYLGLRALTAAVMIGSKPKSPGLRKQQRTRLSMRTAAA